MASNAKSFSDSSSPAWLRPKGLSKLKAMVRSIMRCENKNYFWVLCEKGGAKIAERAIGVEWQCKEWGIGGGGEMKTPNVDEMLVWGGGVMWMEENEDE